MYATHTPQRRPPQPSHSNQDAHSHSADTTHAKPSTHSYNKARRSTLNNTAEPQEVMSMKPNSSRTGTAQWRRVRQQRLDHDRENGVTNCKHCGVWLDYDRSRLPNSAEPDHIEPWHHTRSNNFDGLITICRKCNQSKGGKIGSNNKAAREVKIEYKTKLDW